MYSYNPAALVVETSLPGHPSGVFESLNLPLLLKSSLLNWMNWLNTETAGNQIRNMPSLQRPALHPSHKLFWCGALLSFDVNGGGFISIPFHFLIQ